MHGAEPAASAAGVEPAARTTRIVALVATLVRLLYLADHARSAFFTVPVLDARWFDLYARGLARGEPPAELATGFRAVLYPALLAPLYRLLDSGAVVAAQIAQHAAGVVTAVAAALLARRIFRDEAAALAAGLLFALAPVPLFFEGELLADSLHLAAAAALLWTLAGAEAGAARRFAAAGVLLAVAVQLRPNALLLLVALPFALLRRWTTPRAAAAFAAGVAGATVALALLLAPAAGGFRLLPASGAVNLFLGNARGADGLVPRQGFAVAHADEYRDSVELFAREGARRARADAGARSAEAPSGREIDRHWRRRALDEVAADPAGRLALLGRKAVALLWNGEVPNNRSFDFARREESRLLGLLPGRFALLFGLAAAGTAASAAGPARYWTLGFAATQAAGVLLFFVADRYRLPLYLPAAVLAGGGAAALGRALVARRLGRATRLAALVAAGLVVSLVDWSGARGRLPGDERDLHFRSIARLELGEPAAALVDSERAAALAPADAAIRTQLAAAALASGETGRAEHALARALELAPGEPRVRNLLGVAAERRGDLDAARRRYGEALARAPGYAPALLNAAWLELRSGDVAAAAALAARLPARETAPVQELVLRSALAERAGDLELAARLLAAARASAPETAAALERELSAPSPSRP